MNKRNVLLVATSILAITILAGYAEGKTTSPAVTPAKRTVYMAAVEPKGGTTVDKEPFPNIKLPAGGGYILTAPDKTGRWEVSTYRWAPGTVVVNQGDKVTLEIIGINGNAHPVRIKGYNVTGVVTRGHITRLTFTADKAGIFKIICDTHQPSMQADLVVLANK